ncbi:cytochrome C oxidase subunit IV family protein [Candidatus Laterigemmans baculatus]|uniref:cytochrome C oxidase subunit IV family protein n=1 Tax=Candidatus Laterigemmans baculatus TaxID=2770505 RepID=UPI0013DB5880|nr:cytochrome C oxidase subunit IV family protein [Candidatus Laterigemmans baculatus]
MSNHATPQETTVAHDHAAGDHGHGAHGHGAHGHGAHGHGGRPGWDFAHPFPVWGLVAVFISLLFLTVITVAQASLELGGWDVLLSMLIATIKASLVVLFFMHLAFDKPFNAIVFVSALFFVALFIGGTLSDSRLYSDVLEPQYDEAPAELTE